MLGIRWWTFERNRCYQRSGNVCQACGTPRDQVLGEKKTLHAHEWIEYGGEPGLFVVKEIVALCPYCHYFIHSGFLSVNRKMLDVETILRKGVRVLRCATPPEIFGTTMDMCQEYGISVACLERAPVNSEWYPQRWPLYRLRYKSYTWPAKWNSYEEWRAGVGKE
jgi:hypothetical protein